MILSRPPGLRLFSTSVVHWDHYDALSLPKTASKAAIKANFYKLSKQYHPDVNPNDKGAKEKFQIVSEAYSVLGDDRRRRAYDRQLATGASSESMASQFYQAHSQETYYHHPSSMYENRRRGASHAWESRNRGRTSYHYSPPPYTAYTWGRTHRSGTGHQARQSTRDPFSSPNVRRATGHKVPLETREDRLHKEPGVVRVAQVLGIIFFVVVLNGGFNARMFLATITKKPHVEPVTCVLMHLGDEDIVHLKRGWRIVVRRGLR